METVPRMVEVGEWGELDATETKSFRVWRSFFFLGRFLDSRLLEMSFMPRRSSRRILNENYYGLLIDLING